MLKKYGDKIKFVLLIILIMVMSFFIYKYRHQLTHINIHRLKRFIQSYGVFSAFVFILLYSLKPIVFIVPASLLSILAGNIYGPYMAFVLSMISCFFAGTLGFYLARFLGRGFVNKILRGKLLTIDGDIEKYGFKIMLLMRLSFVFPYDGLSYASGLTKMRYRDFILGTMLGVAPEMLAYSFMGKHLERPFSYKFIFPILVIILVALVTYFFSKKKNK